jgi:RNA polymerase sigma-70 factor (ECF subfamily)
VSGQADDDVDLIGRTAAGDRAAFSQLVARHQRAIYRMARAMTGNDAAAEDVLQETFLAALRGAAGYRGPAPVLAWLRTITRHAVYRLGRRANQVAVPDDTLELLGQAAGWGADDVAVAAERAESHALLRRALAELDPADREILVLRDLEGLPGDEVAATLGLTLPAEKSRLHRARLRLAAGLRRLDEPGVGVERGRATITDGRTS